MTLEESMDELTLSVDAALMALDDARAKVQELEAEREQIAAVLAAFYRAEVSISSLQPILQLAIELNPLLMEQRR